jgi:hypothetical protein
LKTINRLKKEAKESCKFRGHNMSYFKRGPHSTAQDAFCLTCGALVVVQANPPANMPEIHGDAVALHCPVE